MIDVSHKIQAVKNSQFLVLVINYGVKGPVLFCCILVNMVRKYKRRTGRGKFTAADLQDAAGKVNEDKRSIRSVAKEAGICHVTLNRYIMHQSIPSTNIPPPGRPPGFCTLLLPRGRDLYLMTFPGAGFLHIHKITFSTVKKYTFTQLAFGSYLHALHRQFRLSILA